MPIPKGTKLRPDKALTREEINQIIYSLENEEDRVLFMIQYLTASRISEVLALTPKDFFIEEIKGKKFLFIRMPVLKKRNSIEEKMPPIDFNDEFVPHILNYIKKFKEDEKIFKISRHLAWARLNKIKRMRTHTFRKSRLTELVRKYGWDVFDLVKFVGWSSAAPAIAYVRQDTKDLALKLIKEESGS